MKKALLLLSLIVPTLVVVALLFWTTGYFAKAQLIDLAEVTRAPLHRTIGTNGKIEADRISDLRAPLPGTCSRLSVPEGAHLRKGQEILRIDDPSLPSQLAAAQAEFDAAQLDLHEVERGPAPEEIDQAKSDAVRAKLAVDNARKILETNEWLLARAAISRNDVEQSQHALLAAEQELAAAQTKLEDLKSKYGELDLRRARSRIEAGQARLRFLKETLDRLIVRAPEEGTLYQLRVKEGAYLNAGDPIGLLADLSHLRVRAFVDEPEIGQVAIEDKITIHWDAHPRERWDGVVTKMPAEVVALGTRSVAEVLCSIINPQSTLIPNINVDVEIQAAEGPAVPSLPRAVVFPEGSKEFVWLEVEGKAMKHYIQTGQSTSARIEVTGGLSLGDKVIDPDDLAITEGAKVRARSHPK